MNPRDPLEVLKVQGQLFTKVLKVLSEVKKIEKSGYNKHQNYHYSTENDLIGAVKQLLIDNKLIILTDSETKEVIKLYKYEKGVISGENLVTVVNTRHTFCDTDTGYTYPVSSTGTGYDNTDKGSFKAITGALKYFVSKNFLVPTEDDPENDGVTKPTTVTAPKTFGRTPVATIPVTVISTSKDGGPTISTTTMEVEAPPELVITAPLVQPKPSFGRKTVIKQEPSFP